MNENLSHYCPSENILDSKADSFIDLAEIIYLFLKICQCLYSTNFLKVMLFNLLNLRIFNEKSVIIKIEHNELDLVICCRCRFF